MIIIINIVIFNYDYYIINVPYDVILTHDG